MKEFIVKRRKNYVQFTCRIEEELLEEVRKIVKENNLESINSFINECLKFALENLEIEE